MLRARAAPDRPVEALVTLVRDADAGAVPAVTEVLGRIVAELAVAWDTRGNPPGQRHTVPEDLAAAAVEADRPVGATQPMPVVPQRVVEAIHGLGRRLYHRGRIRPVCLLDAASAAAAGDALVASVALDLLERPRATPTELAVLLELLHRAPYEGTRARVHRLLRHRDPHVRKHVIALLARDGGGAEALAATLTVLTGAADVQTARQALAALGQVGARWAAHAVAACLDHPNMNVKKAAAEALRTAGTPATVPHLLAWLGRHDNPGLRSALMSALRAVLGEAADATVLAAAEHAEPGRTRDLLLEALDRALPARSVAALADQGSPAGPALLRLVTAGRVRLRAGTTADLASRMVAHGVTPPATSPAAGPHPDVDALTRHGWHEATARRLATGHDPADLPEALLPGLRRLLPDWLRLAATETETAPAIRPPVLRLVLRCCPAPWTDAERAAFTHSRQALVAGVGELSHADRDGLLAVLEDLAPHLTAVAAFDVASGLRRVPPSPAGRRSTLPLLRRCGAVLTRADLERALADAALGADPWQGEVSVLREAFAVARRAAGEDSRERLAALLEAWPATAPGDRPALLDRMTDLQPIDAPLWTIEEEAHRHGPAPRTPHDGDLDQPRSAVQRDRLLDMLDAPTPGTTQRRRAAEALLDWPEPDVRRRLLAAYLRGDADVHPTAALARTLTAADLTATAAGDDVLVRAVRLAGHLGTAGLAPLVPALRRLGSTPHRPCGQRPARPCAGSRTTSARPSSVSRCTRCSCRRRSSRACRPRCWSGPRGPRTPARRPARNCSTGPATATPGRSGSPWPASPSRPATATPTSPSSSNTCCATPSRRSACTPTACRGSCWTARRTCGTARSCSPTRSRTSSAPRSGPSAAPPGPRRSAPSSASCCTPTRPSAVPPRQAWPASARPPRRRSRKPAVPARTAAASTPPSWPVSPPRPSHPADPGAGNPTG
ncbi:HEAT repeat domain-containing protein [Dactylosporangium sp. NBC_01737]|uniref:HEAT repeat domain-containing protein n=1 Tax=Dactylosporangium sp. NBC_01737 TaxID=2975959 RepID=UPI002E13889E|nr:HEAT repeat domain-containing protein [Dactylosporangium sp. NBC_01737]